MRGEERSENGPVNRFQRRTGKARRRRFYEHHIRDEADFADAGEWWGGIPPYACHSATLQFLFQDPHLKVLSLGRCQEREVLIDPHALRQKGVVWSLLLDSRMMMYRLQ